MDERSKDGGSGLVARIIERLENATGPDRELDVEIGRLQDTLVMMHLEGKNIVTTNWHYTSSIDAALTLVPEGWGYLAGRMGDVNQATLADGGCRVVSCFNDVLDDLEPATPAIALCIAALKARLPSAP